MPERINGGQGLVVVGSLALIVSLFMSWYQPDASAWTVFEVVDLLLAGLALAALAISFGCAIYPGGSLAALAPRWLPILGIAALVLVLGALINHPPAAIGHGTDTGAWIALGAAAALTVGGVLGAARVSLVITLRPRERRTWPGLAPSVTNSNESDLNGGSADTEYADEYAETEYVDAEESGEPVESQPTAEFSFEAELAGEPRE